MWERCHKSTMQSQLVIDDFLVSHPECSGDFDLESAKKKLQDLANAWGDTISQKGQDDLLIVLLNAAHVMSRRMSDRDQKRLSMTASIVWWRLMDANEQAYMCHRKTK